MRLVLVGHGDACAGFRGGHAGAPGVGVAGGLSSELAVAKVAAAPDAGANPDAGNTDYKNDEHDDPLPMVRDPAREDNTVSV